MYKPNVNGLLLPANFADADKAPPVMNEVATTLDGRDITRGYVDPLQLQSSSDEILQLRGGGDYKIYEQVLRDDQVGSVLSQRMLAVTSKEWGVEAGGKARKDQAAADFIKEQVQNLSWDEITKKMLYGVFYGFAVAEALWGRDSRFITLDTIKVRNRKRFGFDGAGRLRMKTFSDPQGELLPERKFWAFATGADHDDEPYGLGLAHWLYWPVLFKRSGLKFWLIFLEKFGQPTAKGTYPSTALPHEKQRLLQALSAITTDAGIAVPEGMTIELLEAARSGSADYMSLISTMDRAISKVVMGQVGSTEGTPGRLGNDDLQGDVRDDLVKADADLICESFNRTVVRWLVEWNFPGAALPRVYRKVTPDEDLNSRAERDLNITQLGFKPTLQYVQDNYGEGWEPIQSVPSLLGPSQPPVPGDNAGPTDAAQAVAGADSVQQTALNGAQIKSLADIIAQVQAGTLDKARAKALVEAGFPAIAPDQISRLLGGADFAAPDELSPAEQMLEQTRERIEPATNAWINQVRELADQVDSLEALRDALLEQYPHMTLDQYAIALSDATATSNLAGRNEVTEETPDAIS